ncbi:MAG: enoyl-CoA hydratase-related protein [Desulfobacterales bacterium]|nr:enoyl-CoA hydratase-related protein [Desulfobacterales bacterium]
MGFMLACDIVIASDDSQFGTPEVNVGLWPMMIGALIFRNVPQEEGHGDDPVGRKDQALPKHLPWA